MAYTKVSQLTFSVLDPNHPDLETKAIYTPENLKNGDGTSDGKINKAETHYYGEDLKIVMEQGGNDNTTSAKLVFINVRFHREDQQNDDCFEIEVIGKLDDSGKVYPILALPWQPYYREVTEEYEPGAYLAKS